MPNAASMVSCCYLSPASSRDVTSVIATPVRLSALAFCICECFPARSTLPRRGFFYGFSPEGFYRVANKKSGNVEIVPLVILREQGQTVVDMCNPESIALPGVRMHNGSSTDSARFHGHKAVN